MFSLHTDMFLINYINRQLITSESISLLHHITQYGSYSYMCTLTNVWIQCRVQYSVTHASVSYISVNNTLITVIRLQTHQSYTCSRKAYVDDCLVMCITDSSAWILECVSKVDLIQFDLRVTYMKIHRSRVRFITRPDKWKTISS